MKNTSLILVLQFLLAVGPTCAQGGEDAPVKEPLSSVHETSAQAQVAEDGNTAPREGDAIWLEEKIARPTRWIESLVKPLTTWMEGKVQRSGEAVDSDQTRRSFEAPVQSNDGDTDRVSAALTSREAAELATQQVSGDVLMVKLISTEQGELYHRVKLISDKGEIHIIYINDSTGELMRPDNRPTANQGGDVR